VRTTLDAAAEDDAHVRLRHRVENADDGVDGTTPHPEVGFGEIQHSRGTLEPAKVGLDAVRAAVDDPDGLENPVAVGDGRVPHIHLGLGGVDESEWGTGRGTPCRGAPEHH
jgi:hypothetical protein